MLLRWVIGRSCLKGFRTLIWTNGSSGIKFFALLLTVPEHKAQGHEENIFSFIPQISKECKLGTKCRDSRGCLARVAHSPVEKSHTEPFLS